jgi:hypothetical protein
MPRDPRLPAVFTILIIVVATGPTLARPVDHSERRIALLEPLAPVSQIQTDGVIAKLALGSLDFENCI